MRRKTTPAGKNAFQKKCKVSATGSQVLKEMLLDLSSGDSDRNMPIGNSEEPSSIEMPAQNLSPPENGQKRILVNSPSRYSLRSAHLMSRKVPGRRLSRYKKPFGNSEDGTNPRKEQLEFGKLPNTDETTMEESFKDEAIGDNISKYPTSHEDDGQPMDLAVLLKTPGDSTRKVEFSEIKNALNSTAGRRSIKKTKEYLSAKELSESLTSPDFRHIVPMKPLDFDEVVEKQDTSNVQDLAQESPGHGKEKEYPKEKQIATADCLEGRVSGPTPKEKKNETSENDISASDDRVLVSEPYDGTAIQGSLKVSSSEEPKPSGERSPSHLPQSTKDICISNIFSLAEINSPNDTDDIFPKEDKKHVKDSSLVSKSEQVSDPIDLSLCQPPIVIKPIREESHPNTLPKMSDAKHVMNNQRKHALIKKYISANKTVNKRSSYSNRLLFSKRPIFTKQDSPSKVTETFPIQHKSYSILKQNLQNLKPMSSKTLGGGKIDNVLILQTPPLVVPVVNKRLMFQGFDVFNKGTTTTPTDSNLDSSHRSGRRLGGSRRTQLSEYMQKSMSEDDFDVTYQEYSPDSSFCESQELYTCGKCHMGFTIESDWLKHQKQHCSHNSEESSLLYYCNRCPVSFNRHRDWVKHRKTHLMTLPRWQCDKCAFNFSSRRDLREHRFRCAVFPEDLDTSQAGHDKTTTKFICKVCHKAFPYPSALRVHQETHILKHKCPVCDQTFTRFYEMTKHVRNVHPDVSSHSCDHCGKVFDRLTILYRHKADGLCTSYQAPKGQNPSTQAAE